MISKPSFPALLAIGVAMLSCVGPLASVDSPRFEQDILPVFYHHCFACHREKQPKPKGKHTGSGQKYQADTALSKDFHVYALEWTPVKLIWYFDGKKVRTLSHTICNADQEVLLSTKVASFAGKPSSALNGKSMDVDYVRIYQKKV